MCFFFFVTVGNCMSLLTYFSFSPLDGTVSMSAAPSEDGQVCECCYWKCMFSTDSFIYLIIFWSRADSKCLWAFVHCM